MKFSFSQNFLTNKVLVKNLILKSNFSKDIPILDIGVGKGIISKILVEEGFKVIGYEIDKSLFDKISSELKSQINYKIYNEDFLESKNLNFKFNVFSNIPFNQTSRIIEKLFLKNSNVQKCYLILQKESAERILGLKEGLFLALQIANFNEVKICHKFFKTDFFPIPKVNVVLLKIERRNLPLIEDKDYNSFLDFISYIILQQKPTILRRLDNLLKYEQIKKVTSLLKIELSNTLYEIPQLKYFDMYKTIKEQYPLVLFQTKDYYKKYIEINLKNIKNYRTRILK